METQIEVTVDTVLPEPLTPEQVAQQEQYKINSEALVYLASTDWYVVRFSETGVAIPDDVKVKRQEARYAIK